ncbi:MAG: DUF1345 domain-containing protein [Pyrinomonadaceae bacterium]
MNLSDIRHLFDSTDWANDRAMQAATKLPDEPLGRHVADRWDPEPRWPALIAILAVGGLYLALPANLTFGPRWLFPGTVMGLLVPTVISHRAGKHNLNKIFGFTVTIVVTAAMIASVVLLIKALPAHQESPTDLLISAASLWFTNILVFALWYWRLDAGGPHRRDSRAGHPEGAFLFPQMTLMPEAKAAAGQELWTPNFIDYLFLAFNTSTAFSPTDVPVLARWAKMLMILQSLISLTVLVLLAARAVNIL